MIRDFLSSWPLFSHSYLSGWLIALCLSLVGIPVVARDQIFVGAAVSQAATLGLALGMWIGGLFPEDRIAWLESERFLLALAVGFSVLAALWTARGGRRGRESYEAITGWVFLVGSSVSVLLVSHSPHGLEEVHRLLFSTLIGATGADVWSFAALAAAVVLLAAAHGRRILLWTMDPGMAAAVGMNIPAWSWGFALLLGVSVGLAMRVSGMLYTFGALVLPPLIAKNLCREMRPMFLVSPLAAVSLALVGFVLANHYDYPPAQMTVALWCGLLVVAWIVKGWRQGR